MGHASLLKYSILIATLIVLCIPHARAYKHPPLEISNDRRRQFFIENFGFNLNGQMIMDVTNFKVDPLPKPTDKLYFVIRITTIDSSELEEAVDFDCNNDALQEQDPRIIPLIQDWEKEPHRVILPKDIGYAGLYNLHFVNCINSKVSFTLKLEQFNFDPDGAKDYLPIGLSPIPTIYTMFSAVYLIMLFVWIFSFIRGQGTLVNKVHHLMTILILWKFLSLVFYAIEQHFEKVDGVPGGWEIAYYIFAVLKTIFFFVIITLIGTGWTFFKPFLSDKDKKIIMVVIPLQVLDNIAMVIVGATPQGSVGWFTWKDIFRLVDIICCGAILIPIIWSIKHLREASQIDGKAARNLQKLRLFRQFYLIVVSYIYFTRIIIYLLDATLQYYLVWLGHVFTEIATLSFFVVVGYKFRPVSGNPYFNIEEEDAARSEEMREAAEED